MDTAFGTNLKSLRLSQKMTQKEIANMMNVNVVTICHWEKSQQEPCIEDIKKICRYFNVTTDFILGM